MWPLLRTSKNKAKCVPMHERSGASMHEYLVLAEPLPSFGGLSKPRRRRQRERHQTKGLMSKTIAVHVRYKSLHISEMPSSVLRRLRHVDEDS